MPDTAAAGTVVRFAPSPTGYLHLGHAYSALFTSVAAEAEEGRLLLRIEDIDGARCRPEFERAILDDLAWLGLTWEEPVRRQSEHMADYQAALDRLAAAGLLYPCFCTRKQIRAEIARSPSAPHGPDGPLYPGTCRAMSADERERRRAAGEPFALRLDSERAVASLSTARRRTPRPPSTPRTPQSLSSGRPKAGPGGREIEEPAISRRRTLSPSSTGRTPQRRETTDDPLDWVDEAEGLQRFSPALFGDVVLARKETPASYHLAVTVDDALQGVTLVTRGRDLLPATHVHRLLQALLGLPVPRYRHHKLIADEEGGRLAKRQGAPSLKDLRRDGVTPEELRRRLGFK